MHCRVSRFIAPASALQLCLLAFVFFCLPTSSMIRPVDTPTIADDVKELFKQAQKQYRKGRQAEAEKLYRQVIDADPNNTDAKLALAYIIAKQRRVREAYDIAFPIVKNDPKNSRAFAVLGATFLIAGHFPEARACLIT